MARNTFRGDAASKPKVLRLIGPSNATGVSAVLTVNNKALEIASWNATSVAAALTAAEFPEMADVTFTASGNDVLCTGPENADFDLNLTYKPTVTVTHTNGTVGKNQQTTIGFNGATGGTFTVTVNGQTTSAVTYGDGAGLLAALEALSNVAPGDVSIVSYTDTAVVLEWKAVFLQLPVAVSVNGAALNNSTPVTIQENQAYRPGPHDIYLLAMEYSTTCSLTVDGASVTLRSDESLSEIRRKIQGLSATKTINVYGGPNGKSDADGITAAHYVLDFAGWTSASRPTVSISSSDGEARVKLMVDPTDASTGLHYSASSATSLISHWLLDFTTGPITLEYDGIQFTLTEPTYATIAADMAAIQLAIRDASEYDEAVTSLGVGSGSTYGFTTGQAINSFYHGKLVHLIGVNDTIRKISGGGNLYRLNYPGTAATGEIHAVSVPPGATGGTFKLKYQEGTTATIAATASAATVQTAVQAVITSATVSGSGTAASPWLITYPSARGSIDLPTASEVALTGAGTATVSVSQAAVKQANSKTKIAVGSTASGGSFTVRFGEEGPVSIAYGASAATVETAIATFPGVGSTSNVDVTYDSNSRVYAVEFVGSLAGTITSPLSLAVNSLTGTASAAKRVDQRPTGPANFADSANWTLGRLPQTGDDVLFDVMPEAVTYGLRQFVKATVATATELFTAVSGHDFTANQPVQVLTEGTLPSGLSAATTYYVIDPDIAAGTFRLSASQNGAAINITSTGTGDFYVGVIARSLSISTEISQIGLPEQGDFREYRPRSLKLGVSVTADIGVGAGLGGSLIRLDFGNSIGVVRVSRAGSRLETQTPAVAMLADSANIQIAIMDGDAGVAAADDETARVKDLSIHGGELTCGVVTVVNDFYRRAGTLRQARSLTVTGSTIWDDA